MPRLNADKAVGLFRLGPDQYIGIALNVAAHGAAGILFHNGKGLAAQVQHAVAVVVKEVIRQGHGAGIAGQIVIIGTVQQAVGQTAHAQGAFQLVKTELIIRRGVGIIKRDGKCRVVTNAEPELRFAGIIHRQGVAHRFFHQLKGGAQLKLIGPLGAGLLVCLQNQGQTCLCLAHQGVLHIAGKAVLAAGILFALGDHFAAGQLAGIGEQDRRMAAPDGRVPAPEHFGPGSLVDNAHSLGTMGIHRQAQVFVFNGILHNIPSYSL